MIQIKKTILTLVALLAVTTGAWAESKPIGLNVEYAVGDVITTNSTGDVYVWWGIYSTGGDNYEWVIKITSSVTPTISKLGIDESSGSITFDNDYGVYNMNGIIEANSYKIQCQGKVTGTTLEKVYVASGSGTLTDPYVFAPGPAASGNPFPITWSATTPNTASIDKMPAGNVTINVEYYPQATVADGAVTAATGVKATTEDALVTIDKSKLTGVAKLMYFVSTKTTAPDYDTEGWTSEVPTAADITMAKTVYVWYYPVGADSDNPAKTYSDGEMNINALQVAVADPPTYAITLAEGTEDAGKWTISPAEATKGSTVTVTYEGPRKVMGVKAEKKGGAPDPKLATPLTIEAITPGIISVSSPKEGMQFSLDDGATKNAVTTTINVAAGDKVQFYGNGTSITSYYGTTITGSGNGFTCKVYGNIMSLVDETGFATAKTLSANPTFYRLFYENTTLTDASGLLLPATELASYCYSQMFRDCTSLTAAPELPATELASNCYRSMFMGCTALTTAPVLLATTLVESCYYQIFTNCSKLATVTCLATSGINDNFSTANWLNGTGSQVEGTKTVYTVSTANWPEGNKSGIPTGWTRVNVDN